MATAAIYSWDAY